jgi:hypothetical protein
VVAAQVAELRLEGRFCGPPASANGGYDCGSIAGLLGGGVEVTLRRPPLLGRLLRLRVDDGGAVDARPLGRRPNGLVMPAVISAALDYPSGFAAGVGDRVMVLGRMAARVLACPCAAGRTAWSPGAGTGGRPQAASRLGAAGRPWRGAGGRAHRLAGHPQTGAGTMTVRLGSSRRWVGRTGRRRTNRRARIGHVA